MAALQLNSDELEAMRGLPLITRVLYLELRARMDYSSGLVGARRGAGVSWRTFQEGLYVEPHQGIDDSGTPSPMKVRRAAEWLRKVGLIVNRTEGMRVFFLPLATTDKSVRNKPDTNPTGTRQGYPDRQPDRREPQSGAECDGKPDRQPDTNPTGVQPQKPDTPPVSGIRKGVVDTQERTVEVGEGARATSISNAGRYAAALRKQSVDVTSANPVLLKWIDEGVTMELLLECTTIARRRKPKQRIPLGYLATIVEDQRSGSHNGVPDWARLPRRDEEIEPWAIKHGYPRAPRGMQTYHEYRTLLRTHIERRMNEHERGEDHAEA